MKYIIQILVLFTLLLQGCVKESFTEDKADIGKVTLQVRTRAYIGVELEGVKIEKLRFLLFSSSGQNPIVANYSTTNGTLQIDDNGVFDLLVVPGNYWILAVINETSEMTEQLNEMFFYSDISNISYGWQNITSQNIPLINYGELSIEGDIMNVGKAIGSTRLFFDKDGPINRGSYNWSIYSNVVDIDMVRALSQVSLFVRKGDGVSSEIKINSVKIGNLTEKASLYDNYLSNLCIVDMYTGSPYELFSSGGGTTYNGKEYHSPLSAIIPEKSFNNSSVSDSDPTNAAYLLIDATFDGIPTTYKILLGESDTNFALNRNTIYRIYVTITKKGESIYPVYIEYEVTKWDIAGNGGFDIGTITSSGRWVDGTNEDHEDPTLVYVANNTSVTYTFTLSFPPGAKWTAQLSNFIDFDFDLTGDGVREGVTEAGVTKYIKIRPRGSVSTNNVFTQFYITVDNGIETVELDITNENKRYIIKQIPN